MKKLIFATLSCCLLLAACYDLNEEVVIRDNGSGHYTTRMDLSGLLELMQTFGSEEELTKNGLDRPIDTLIMLRSVTDSSNKLSADERAVMQTGKMHMVMNMEKKAFTVDMDFDFRNNEDLQFLLAGAGNGGFGRALKNVLQNEKTPANELDAPKDLDIDQLGNIYDVTVQNGVISKKIDRTKLEAMLQNPEMAQLKQMGGAIEMLSTTTIVLPRPLKSISNTGFKVSDDKKKVTIKNNLLDVFEKPELFEYKLVY